MSLKTLIDPDWVVLTWVTMGIEDFFLSFRMSEMVGHSRYDPFINAMGLELICKGYLLAIHRSEYEGLIEIQAKEKINKLARDWGHNISDLIENQIKKNIGEEMIQPLLDKEFRKIRKKEKAPHLKSKNPTGKILNAIEAAYLECRYPVPHPFYKNKDFKVNGLKDGYWDLLYSSDVPKYCYEICRIILADLKEKFGIRISELWWNQKIADDAGRRFENLFFDTRKEEFLSKN